VDYGHEIELGSFLTPVAADPARVVELAQVSERAGLDLVTFQDHPYQGAFLDTLTLLAFVAARTSRVRVAANVHSLPMRPPAVLARSLASLDVLSGGRVELGLGAGAFWDAIEAMGGPRRSPGEAVEALSEAIDVIRGVWDTSTHERLVVEGEHYRLDGAKRGPQPAHDMSIWVGAYKPRMLRLVGQKADGWLPSLSYLRSPQDLGDGNARIDEAARAAGRDPRDIRRLLNVGPLPGGVSDWAEHLAGLALEHGVSVFILGSDDDGVLRAFGEEVGPAVRELVARERRPAA